MMTSWWRNKNEHKRNNWALLAFSLAMVAGMTVEALGYLALIGAAPGFVIGWLEVLR